MCRNPAGVEAACELPHLPGVGHEQPEAANVRLRNRVGGWFSRPSDRVSIEPCGESRDSERPAFKGREPVGMAQIVYRGI